MKRTIVSVMALCLVAATMAPVGAEERGVTCKMTGTAELKPGLRAPGPDYYGDHYKVKIEGEFTDCQGSQDVPASGTFTALVKGDGTCVQRSGEGVTSIKWDNGNETRFDFRSNDGASIATIMTTITKSNEPAMQEGDEGIGVLKFTADTAKCNTPDGVEEATFEGQFVSGSSS